MVQVSPIDLQAWAEATGNPYPTSAAEKAAVLPQVLAWKQGVMESARESRGQNALATPLMVAGGAGLGLAGLAAYNHFRRRGLSEPAAAAQAKAVEQEVDTTTAAGAGPAAPGEPGAPTAATTPERIRALLDPDAVASVRKTKGDGTRLVAPLEYTKVDPGNRMGGQDAHFRGEYRRGSAFHNPNYAGLDTEEKQIAFLMQLAAEQGENSREFAKAVEDINLLRNTQQDGVWPGSLLKETEDQQLGTRDPRDGSFTPLPGKSGASKGPGYLPRSMRVNYGAIQRPVDHGSGLFATLEEIAGEDYALATEKAIEKRVRPDLNKSPALLGVSPGTVDMRRALFDSNAVIGAIESQLGDTLAYEDKMRVMGLARAINDARGPEGAGIFIDQLGEYLGAGFSEPQRAAIVDAFSTQRPLNDDAAERVQAWGGLARNLPATVLGTANLAVAPTPDFDPRQHELFFLDSDNQVRPYLGSEPQSSRLEQRPLITSYGSQGEPLPYTGRKLDGSPIAESDTLWFPVNNHRFYELTGAQHPAWTLDDVSDADIRSYTVRNGIQFPSTPEDKSVLMSRVIAFKNGGLNPPRYMNPREDRATKGLELPLPEVGAQMSGGNTWAAEGYSRDGEFEDRWIVVPDGAGGRAVVDDSGGLSEATNPHFVAARRLQLAQQDYETQTGKPLPMAAKLQWAAGLGKQHGSDAATILGLAEGQVGAPPVPPADRTRVHAHPLGQKGKKALERVYRSLGRHAKANAWELEGLVRSGNIKAAAEALGSTIPGLAEVNGGILRGQSQDVTLNVIAEGLTAGLQDLATTLEKNPDLVEKFGIGPDGNFGVDGFIKTYVRDWATLRSLELSETAQPVYQVPNDTFEVLAYDANSKGRSVLDEVQSKVAGSKNAAEAVLRLDRMMSAAQSMKTDDANTEATNVAQRVFSLGDKDLNATKLLDTYGGSVAISFATFRKDDASAGFWDRNPSEQVVDERLQERDEKLNWYNPESNTSRPDRLTEKSENAILRAMRRGIDTGATDPDRKAVMDQSWMTATTAQSWIDQNQDFINREREDLNRGIVNTQRGPVSIGRGLLIASDGRRGAYLAANVEGSNASYRDDVFSENEDVAIDVQEDRDREAVVANQVDLEQEQLDGAVAQAREAAEREASLEPLVAQNPADRTARDYGATKLYWKNLGSPGLGMSMGEASAPLTYLRRYLAEKQEDARLGQALDAVLPGRSWVSGVSPESSWSAPSLRQPEIRPWAPSSSSATVSQGPDYIRSTPKGNYVFDRGREVNLDDLGRSDRQRLNLPFTLEGAGIDSYGTFQGVPRPPADPMAGVIQTPRGEVIALGSPETAARQNAAITARAGTSPRGEAFLDDSRLLYDEGEVSGTGRRGSTFDQAPLQGRQEEEAKIADLASYFERAFSGNYRDSAAGDRVIFSPAPAPYVPPGEAKLRQLVAKRQADQQLVQRADDLADSWAAQLGVAGRPEPARNPVLSRVNELRVRGII